MSSEIIKQQQRHFLPAAGHDLFLPLYDPLVSWLGGDRARQTLIDQANIEPHQRVLDIGCGTGTLAVQIKRLHSTVQVTGLDPDTKALDRARRKAKRASAVVQLDQGFSDDLPYEESSFDRVVSSFMFHHLEPENRMKTLQEVVRALRTGGSFHLLDFAGRHDGSHGALAHLIHSSDRLKDNTDERILKMMQDAGFAQVAKAGDGRMFFGLLRSSYYKATK